MATINTINVGDTEYKFDYDGCVENGPVPTYTSGMADQVLMVDDAGHTIWSLVIPRIGQADVGKVLRASAAGEGSRVGTYSWDELIPTCDSHDIGRVLVVNSDAEPVWGNLPIATDFSYGMVKFEDLPIATEFSYGTVKYDGTTIDVDSNGRLCVSDDVLVTDSTAIGGYVLMVDPGGDPAWTEIPAATSAVFGMVKYDGSTIDVDSNGRLRAIGGGSSVDVATQAEAEAGTNNTKMMTPLRVKQAVASISSALAALDTRVTALEGGSSHEVSGDYVSIPDATVANDYMSVPGATVSNDYLQV